MCNNVCEEIGTQLVKTVNLKFRLFLGLDFLSVVYIYQCLNTFVKKSVVFLFSFNFSSSLLLFSSQLFKFQFNFRKKTVRSLVRQLSLLFFCFD